MPFKKLKEEIEQSPPAPFQSNIDESRHMQQSTHSDIRSGETAQAERLSSSALQSAPTILLQTQARSLMTQEESDAAVRGSLTRAVENATSMVERSQAVKELEQFNNACLQRNQAQYAEAIAKNVGVGGMFCGGAFIAYAFLTAGYIWSLPGLLIFGFGMATTNDRALKGFEGYLATLGRAKRGG